MYIFSSGRNEPLPSAYFLAERRQAFMANRLIVVGHDFFKSVLRAYSTVRVGVCIAHGLGSVVFVPNVTMAEQTRSLL